MHQETDLSVGHITSDHRIHEPPRETVNGYLTGVHRPSKFTPTVPIMGRSDARRLYLSADPRKTTWVSPDIGS